MRQLQHEIKFVFSVSHEAAKEQPAGKSASSHRGGTSSPALEARRRRVCHHGGRSALCRMVSVRGSADRVETRTRSVAVLHDFGAGGYCRHPHDAFLRPCRNALWTLGGADRCQPSDLWIPDPFLPDRTRSPAPVERPDPNCRGAQNATQLASAPGGTHCNPADDAWRPRRCEKLCGRLHGHESVRVSPRVLAVVLWFGRRSGAARRRFCHRTTRRSGARPSDSPCGRCRCVLVQTLWSSAASESLSALDRRAKRGTAFRQDFH